MAHGELCLQTSLALELAIPYSMAVRAGTIPLWKTAPGRRAEDLHLHEVRLQLCARVGVDFAAQRYFFKNRSGPSHDPHPFPWSTCRGRR